MSDASIPDNQVVWVLIFEFCSPSGLWKQGIDCYASLDDASEKADTMQTMPDIYRNIMVRGRDVQSREYVKMIKGTTV